MSTDNIYNILSVERWWSKASDLPVQKYVCRAKRRYCGKRFVDRFENGRTKKNTKKKSTTTVVYTWCFGDPAVRRGTVFRYEFGIGYRANTPVDSESGDNTTNRVLTGYSRGANPGRVRGSCARKADRPRGKATWTVGRRFRTNGVGRTAHAQKTLGWVSVTPRGNADGTGLGGEWGKSGRRREIAISRSTPKSSRILLRRV